MELLMHSQTSTDATVEVREWINNLIPCTGHVIIYACWDQSQTVLVKRNPGC